jgi:hypothetical protein
MRFEVGELCVGMRLYLTPFAIEDVLPGVDKFARLGHRGVLRQVFGDGVIVLLPACDIPAIGLPVPLLNTAISIPFGRCCSVPDIEVVFARGTGSPPGIGWVGEAFVDSLRSKVSERSVEVYAVNYPATWNFSTSASAGAKDANAHVQYMAANCPSTRMVLGGMSQGAA